MSAARYSLETSLRKFEHDRSFSGCVGADYCPHVPPGETKGGNRIYITVLLFKGEILRYFMPSNDIGLVSVILNEVKDLGFRISW